MSRMLEEYDHLLNIDYDRNCRIAFTGAENLITTAGRRTEKLDGIWNFTPDVYDTFIRKRFFDEVHQDEKGREKPVDFDFDQWMKIHVPSNWNVLDDKFWFFEGSGIYTRKFRYFRRDEDKVFLRIGAANYEARVWLNGKLIGRHEGGFTPFMLDVTDELREENRLILQVNNERKLEQIPSVNYDWFNYGGVFRSIELVRLPAEYIKDAFIRLVPDGGFNHAAITVQTVGTEAGETVTVDLPELNLKTDITVDASGKAEKILELHPVLWSPETPRLYKAVITCKKDSISEMVGFREIRCEGKKIFLNGREIFLKGVCCHEESLQNGRALTQEEQIHILQTAKDMGCNIIRLSHYPHSENMSILADRMGIMLWEEIPVYWALCFDREDTYQNASNQLKEMILRDRNRASVVIWGIGNENPDTDSRLVFMKKLSDLCGVMDSTRLTAAACLVNIDEMKIIDRLCNYVDVVAMNEYYGWYYRDYNGLKEILENSVINKPIVISETGADSVCGHFGDEEELFTENHQARMYREQFKIAKGYVSGTFPWILFDFRSPIRLNPLQGSFNRKGLVGEDKTYRKMAYAVVKEFYESM
jgi:beta-glucuronidase